MNYGLFQWFYMSKNQNLYLMNEKKDITKEYSNGEVTIVWKPNVCIHSERCFHGLPKVFDPKARPWINALGASSPQIVEQVKKCPSGALSYYFNEQGPASEASLTGGEERMVEVTPNGPLLVHGQITIKHPDGNLTRKETKTAFCRCGASGNKPFCDGSHRKVGFEG